ncbi:MAG: carboxypeptidase-like regulatory domain-containing protein [Cytophagales bacterium]|nr:carboxypeptidase-like regulatory domain-containing protein [Cytophagales bacterium]
MPLHQVLKDLHKRYGLQFSYDHSLISSTVVSDSTRYESPEKAVEGLLEKAGLRLQALGDVYVVLKKKILQRDTLSFANRFYYSGQVTDSENGEPLPFSSVQWGGQGLNTDAQGFYSFFSRRPQERVSISYLGYYLLDTLLSPGRHRQLRLRPSTLDLDEVVVLSAPKIPSAVVGKHSAQIKVNHQAAAFLPGNNNSTIFYLLRLQPGVLAASEQEGHYSLWGSYPGQTQIKFDGITLFSGSSLNNEIGAVSPLMLQSVEVYKAAYSHDKGDRVGGAIHMTGKVGNTESVEAQLNLNTQTVSGRLNVPIANRYALQAAFRQTYYQVIDWEEVFTGDAEENRGFFSPDFSFQDVNVKFSGKLPGGDLFYVSTLANRDRSESTATRRSKKTGEARESRRREVEKSTKGISAHYAKNWSGLGTTHFSGAFSGFRIQSFDRSERRPGEVRTHFSENGVNEKSFGIDHQFPAASGHEPHLQVKVTQHSLYLMEDTVDWQSADRKNKNTLWSAHLKDDWQIGRWGIQPGLKLNYLAQSGSWYLLPRLGIYMVPSDNWRLHAAWGKYNQYISERAIYDASGNFFQAWRLHNDVQAPVVQGEHFTGGLSFQKNGFQWSTEGFYKTTQGIRRVFSEQRPRLESRRGESRGFGADIYIRKRWNRHHFWVAYTLSRTEERFSGVSPEFCRAAHDQLHELKVAGILDFDPWFIAANYVYGSGLYGSAAVNDGTPAPYNRLDAAVLYRFQAGRMRMEAGASFVNLTNARNVGNSNFSNLPSGKILYSKGVSFTPSMFLKVEW